MRALTMPCRLGYASHAQMDHSTLSPGCERVHFVLGYYDGVLEGVADYEAIPHHFIVEVESKDGDHGYRVTPLSPEAFAMANESWEIWERPHRTQTSAPRDPLETQRQEELDARVQSYVAAHRDQSFLARAEFSQRLSGAWLGTTRDVLEVRWRRLDSE